MIIPQEIINSRHFTVYGDTDPELLISVELYNARMTESRKRFRGLIRFEMIFLALELAMLVIIGMIPTAGVFLINPRIQWLEWTAFGVFAAAYIYFGLWKRNFIVLTVFSLLLILADARLAVLFVLNIVLTVVRESRLRYIKSLEGYPLFARIRVEKKDGSTPADSVEGSAGTERENFAKPLDKSARK